MSVTNIKAIYYQCGSELQYVHIDPDSNIQRKMALVLCINGTHDAFPGRNPFLRTYSRDSSEEPLEAAPRVPEHNAVLRLPHRASKEPRRRRVAVFDSYATKRGMKQGRRLHRTPHSIVQYLVQSFHGKENNCITQGHSTPPVLFLLPCEEQCTRACSADKSVDCVGTAFEDTIEE